MGTTPSPTTLARHLELCTRAKTFAIRVMKLCDFLPTRRSCNAIANQLLRSGMSVAANYRAAGRARSKAEFAAKLGIVVEEADETIFWLELLIDGGMVREKRLQADR